MVEDIKRELLQRYKNAKTELRYNNEYELLVAIMLSAQCTDKRVNIITPELFAKYPSIKALANADINEVKKLIKSCSFFNNKAKNLIKTAQILIDKYNGKIPHNYDDLISLAGVGNKTANVFLIEMDNANKMAVDTHVFRVSHRLGLSRAKTPEATERDLVKLFQDNLSTLHQAMVLFGRYVCTAKNPKCNECFLQHYCKSKDKTLST
ncbi:MAG: endonuclease III [Epsilonproteobacteria bacterium]|nr:endonuclease III [Campylobacterota bacterium]